MLAATEEQIGVRVLALLVVTIIVVILLFVRWRPRLLKAGYPSLMAYLRCVPRTDAQKRDALDLMLRGVVVFFIGFVFAPIPVPLVGLVLFYYGFRKLCLIWMRLEILDEADGLTGEPHGQPAPNDAAP